MYIWNDLKIIINDEKNILLQDIENYFLLRKSDSDEKHADITISIYGFENNYIHFPNEGSRLIKTLDFEFDKKIRLNIFTNEKELWYLYGDIATVWIDLIKNKIIVQAIKNPFDFKYYNLLYFFLYPLSKLLGNFGFFSLHSSSAIIEDKAMLFTGESGSGKSTSAFAIAVNGGMIISDDLSFVKKENNFFKLYPLTKLVKLNESALKTFFPQLLNYEFLKSDNKDVYIDNNNLSGNIDQSVFLSAISILNKSGEESTSFQNIHPLKVIPHIFPSSINTNIERNTKEKFDFIADLLENTKCYAIEFGTDMADFYENIKKILLM